MLENGRGTPADARDSITVKRVFGESYEHGGVTVILAAALGGGGGGILRRSGS